ncbi:hypothetical protein [Nocardioides sambongensis]|uniref:hypothetical protein n=1 Tax=Nocardioides sambongensis TaxID=2589074 RepID=UPI0011273385|nr:hypothetical protein [Nocardioides sambongensis]
MRRRRPSSRRLGAALVEERCWCGRPRRGVVAAARGVLAHHCGQCAEHCTVALYLERVPTLLRRGTS